MAKRAVSTTDRRRERERAARQAEELIKANFYGRAPRNFNGSDEFGGECNFVYGEPVVWRNFGNFCDEAGED